MPEKASERAPGGLIFSSQGAKSSVVQKYAAMATTQAFLHPLAWTKPGFTLDDYALILFPGGHDKGIRQMIDSPIVHRLIIDYFPKTKKPGKKAVAAICHGVMALSNAKDVKSGRSPISTCATTALPGFMESFIYQSTRLFLGDCYKTYGAGSENVEQSVCGFALPLLSPSLRYSNPR